MKITLWELYRKFVKIGAILIGGGYVILPILKKEVVETKQWITEDELIDFYAISQSLPGLIAANISIFIGYKLKGIFGALASILGILTTPFICIASISSILSQFSENIYVKGIFWGIGIGVIILLISSLQELWKKSIVDKFALLMFLVFLYLILKLNITPAQVILSSIIIGILYHFLKQKRGNI